MVNVFSSSLMASQKVWKLLMSLACSVKGAALSWKEFPKVFVWRYYLSVHFSSGNFQWKHFHNVFSRNILTCEIFCLSNRDLTLFHTFFYLFHLRSHRCIQDVSHSTSNMFTFLSLIRLLLLRFILTYTFRYSMIW